MLCWMFPKLKTSEGDLEGYCRNDVKIMIRTILSSFKARISCIGPSSFPLRVYHLRKHKIDPFGVYS